jgi:L-ascorbate metabolism protein UlaG (beta-lactamase superfamily)
MNVRFLGHSSFLLEFRNSSVLMDPCVYCESLGPHKRLVPSPVKLEDLPKISLILITSEHEDHFDKKTIEFLVHRDNACVVAHDSVLSELNIPARCKRPVSVDAKLHVRGVNISVQTAHFPRAFYPMAYLLEADNTRVYHAGNSDLLEDYSPAIKADVAILPIGGNVTMDIVDAVKATKMLKPEVVIPMHYNTFEIFQASPDEFAKKIEKSNLQTRPVVLGLNESFEFKPAKK